MDSIFKIEFNFSDGVISLGHIYPTEFYAYGSTVAVIENAYEFSRGDAVKIEGIIYEITALRDVFDLDGNKIANGVSLSRLGADTNAE